MSQNTSTAFPRPATALSGPLQELERRLPAHREEVQRLGTPAPGMQFEFPAVAGPCSGPDRLKNPDDCASGVAAPAAAREQPRALEPSVSEPKTTGSRQ